MVRDTCIRQSFNVKIRDLIFLFFLIAGYMKQVELLWDLFRLHRGNRVNECPVRTSKRPQSDGIVAKRTGRAFVTVMRIYVRGIVCEGSRQRLRSTRRDVPRSIDRGVRATPNKIFFARRSRDTSLKHIGLARQCRVSILNVHRRAARRV